jgi:hypothetical protein
MNFVDKVLLQSVLTDKIPLTVTTMELAGVQGRAAVLAKRLHVDEETVAVIAIAVAHRLLVLLKVFLRAELLLAMAAEPVVES